MKKFFFKNVNVIYILIIILVVMLEIFLITRGKYLFGMHGDWLVQNVSLYEYFRNLFHETKNLFPDLALHIGAGQNIYYFAYYGLFSPFVLLFYFFSNVSSGDFIIITNVLNIIISSILLYIFLIKSNYDKNISLFGSLLLSTNTSFIINSSQYIMFVQYMPFLILGLLGTKKYLESKKSLLLVISVILIIMTSYYFSVSSIICLCLYALYYYIKINPNFEISNIFKTGIKYISRILLSIIISSFLLFPVLYVILNGRSYLILNFNFNELLPGINIKYFMYSSAGLGLSSIVCFSIIYNFLYLKKENKILSIFLVFLFAIPIFNLMLNGLLYIDGKVFIPFIPLFIILILEMISSISNHNNKKIFCTFVFLTIISPIIIKFENSLIIPFYCDLLYTFIILFLYKKTNKKILIYLIVLLVGLLSVYGNIKNDTLLTNEKYDEINEIINLDLGKYINNDIDNIYRYENNINAKLINYSDAKFLYNTTMYSSTLNLLYNDIFYNVFNSNFKNTNILNIVNQKNLFFEKFMGIRYFLTKGTAPYGYKKIIEYNQYKLYENDSVYSLGFALSNLLSYDDYNKLSFIEQLEAYQNNIIIYGKSSDSYLNFNYEKLDLNYKMIDITNLIIKNGNGHYIINSNDNGRMSLVFDKTIKNKTLVIKFKVNNDVKCDFSLYKKENMSITINGIANKLDCKDSAYYNKNNTFDYVISSNNNIKKLDISFYKGIYDISDIEVYAIDNSFFDENNTTPLNIDFDKTKGDNIYGNIDVKKSGYFIFTIPYDKGFTVYVDNKKVEIEQVNGGFIGFKIDKGKHDIHLTFEAPYAKLGRIISLFGIVMLIILYRYERKNNKI